MRFLFLLLVASITSTAAAQSVEVKLSDYLNSLNQAGFRIVYSSDLVTDQMRISVDPGLTVTAADLSGILRPHGLKSRPGPAGSILVVRAAVNLSDQRALSERTVVASPIPEIVVTSSLHRLEYSKPETHTYLDRDLHTRMPTVADEAVRLTNRLPGTASGGVTAKSHVRGGEVDEVLFLFDGLRLYEPYHLKDFQAVSTIVNSNAIDGMDFFTGAFPAHYGDRMSGVLKIDMREPQKTMETELALSFFSASALSLGTFGNEHQGEWLVSARRGNLDLVFDVVGSNFGSPNYQDYLGHFAWEFGPRTDFAVNFLVSDDKISLNDNDRGETASASYSNQVFWVKWGAQWSGALRSDSILAISDITDRRTGSVDLPGIVSGALDDFGKFNVVEFRQDWAWTLSDSAMLRLGLNIKDLDARYRFSSTQTIEAPFDSILENESSTSRDFNISPAGAQYAAYSEIRWRPIDRLTVDIGLRWDQQNYTTAADDKQYSPRASILYQPRKSTDIRFGWGQYHQAQEINELQVSDGVAEFFPAQRAEHFVLSFQQQLSTNTELSLSVYRKSFRTIRPRFENAFNTLTLLPELQFDRSLVDAANAESVGAELTMTHGEADGDRLWWLSYAWSDVEDETPFGDQKRSWNQVHTVKAGASWRWNLWNFSIAGQWHSGWPKTTLTGNLVNSSGLGQDLELTVSERNVLNFANFHSLDARVSRDFDVTRGSLTAFLEITNLYNQANPCCVEYSVAADGSLASKETHWLPLVPSVGIVWRF